MGKVGGAFFTCLWDIFEGFGKYFLAWKWGRKKKGVYCIVQKLLQMEYIGSSI